MYIKRSRFFVEVPFWRGQKGASFLGFASLEFDRVSSWPKVQ